MKKLNIIGLSLLLCFLFGCGNKHPTTIDDTSRESENGLSVNDTFNNQIKNAEYILDLQDFFKGTDKESIKTEINSDFDEKSTLQGGLKFSKEKISIGKDENTEIIFNIIANSTQDKKEPFEASGNLSLLYKQDEIYVQLHNFGLFMGEENINAKMYTLLADLIRNKRVDLEIHNNGIIKVEDDNPGKLSENLEKILTVSTEEGNPEFLSNLSEFIKTINSYINIGISNEDLAIKSAGEISYSELNDGIIQKEFTGHFIGKESTFDFSFTASTEGIDIKIFNIESINDGDLEDGDCELSLSIENTDKGEYKFDLKSSKLKQKVIDCKGTIEYGNTVKISGTFILEPIELISGQKISGTFNGKISKDNGDNLKLPELTGNILLFNELLKSLQ